MTNEDELIDAFADLAPERRAALIAACQAVHRVLGRREAKAPVAVAPARRGRPPAVPQTEPAPEPEPATPDVGHAEAPDEGLAF